MSRIFTTAFASVYTLYIAKVERKGRSAEEVETVTCWLTGYSPEQLKAHLDAQTTFEDFFAQAPMNPAASLITGTVCGIRVEDVADPLMKQIRYLDKLVDEIAKGRAMDRILRA